VMGSLGGKLGAVTCVSGRLCRYRSSYCVFVRLMTPSQRSRKLQVVACSLMGLLGSADCTNEKG
jgi:hypothetical protein